MHTLSSASKWSDLPFPNFNQGYSNPVKVNAATILENTVPPPAQNSINYLGIPGLKEALESKLSTASFYALANYNSPNVYTEGATIDTFEYVWLEITSGNPTSGVPIFIDSPKLIGTFAGNTGNFKFDFGDLGIFSIFTVYNPNAVPDNAGFLTNLSQPGVPGSSWLYNPTNGLAGTTHDFALTNGHLVQETPAVPTVPEVSTQLEIIAGIVILALVKAIKERSSRALSSLV